MKQILINPDSGQSPCQRLNIRTKKTVWKRGVGEEENFSEAFTGFIKIQF